MRVDVRWIVPISLVLVFLLAAAILLVHGDTTRVGVKVDPVTGLLLDPVQPARVLIPMGAVTYFDTTGTAVTISSASDGSTNMVPVAVASALDADSREFDNGGSDIGRLRYTGEGTRLFYVVATASFEPSNINESFVLGVSVNGAASSGKTINGSGISTTTQTVTAHAFVELTTNDYVECYIGNLTAGHDVTAQALNVFAMGF